MLELEEQNLHIEPHHRAPEFIRDIVIGMSDGLTVPFALAAGLTGSVSTTTLIVTAGMAEIAAGAIAMGLGGYLAVKTDHEYYVAELERERLEVDEMPHIEREEVASILRRWGLAEQTVNDAVESITENPKRWIAFMMRYELGLEKPAKTRARNSSLTIGLSYITGGLIPLLPYILFDKPATALLISVLVTLLALLVFGYVKGKFTGTSPLKSSLQTALVGGVAAGVAFMAAKWLA